jgi:mannose-1-phosphate guanylyltransferase
VRGRIRTAFVLGAGLGTRLRPLTLVRPKPLFPIFGKPLITFALDHLLALGVESFVINAHHLSEQLENLFASGAYSGCRVKLVHESELLETGGGIKNAEPWIGSEPFIVYSGDILTDIELERLVDEHFRKENDVTLALRKTGLASGLSLNAEGQLTGISAGQSRRSAFDFANVSVWSPAGFRRIPAGKKVSFVPILAEWLREGGRIGGVVLEEREWFNIGSRTAYLNVHRTIHERGWRPEYLRSANWPVTVAPDAAVSPTACLSGFNAIGAGCVVEGATTLEDCILWEISTIRSESILRGCVVAGSLVISGRHENVDFTPLI